MLSRLSPLVGREVEIAAVTDRLRDPSVRIVTLLGPGGVGKTRLALAVAERVRTAFEDGVEFVSLATASTSEQALCEIAAEAGRENNLYEQEDLTVAHAVREWAIAKGTDPRYRIALCGYDTEHGAHMPADWTPVKWKAKGGYGSQSNGAGRANRHREVIWFSPHCLEPDRPLIQSLFDDFYRAEG